MTKHEEGESHDETMNMKPMSDNTGVCMYVCVNVKSTNIPPMSTYSSVCR